MLEMEIIEPNMLEMELSGQIPSTIGGTTNYNELSGKPKINGVELKGDKTLDELNIASKDYVEQEIATFDFIKIVSELPEQGLINRTYLVTKKENATKNDLYDEYLWVNNGTEEEPNYDWEYQGTKTIEVDLTDYVKNTDLVNFDNRLTKTPGLVLPFSPADYSNGGIGVLSTNDGQLVIARALNKDIDNRTVTDYMDAGVHDVNRTHPICPANLDYAVKKALSSCKLIGTENAWTDEEKANARELLGINALIEQLRAELTGESN